MLLSHCASKCSEYHQSITGSAKWIAIIVQKKQTDKFRMDRESHGYGYYRGIHSKGLTVTGMVPEFHTRGLTAYPSGGVAGICGFADHECVLPCWLQKPHGTSTEHSSSLSTVISASCHDMPLQPVWPVHFFNCAQVS